MTLEFPGGYLLLFSVVMIFHVVCLEKHQSFDVHYTMRLDGDLFVGRTLVETNKRNISGSYFEDYLTKRECEKGGGDVPSMGPACVVVTGYQRTDYRWRFNPIWQR